MWGARARPSPGWGGGVKLFVRGALGLPTAAVDCRRALPGPAQMPTRGARGARARAGKPAFTKMPRSLSNRVPETPERELGNS